MESVANEVCLDQRALWVMKDPRARVVRSDQRALLVYVASVESRVLAALLVHKVPRALKGLVEHKDLQVKLVHLGQ